MKSARKFRKKAASDDEKEAEAPKAVVPKATVKGPAPKTAPKLVASRSTLSFGDDEEGEEFKVAKPKASRKEQEARKDKASSKAVVNTQHSRVGEYTPEKMAELQQKTKVIGAGALRHEKPKPSLPPRETPKESVHSAPGDVTIKLKGLPAVSTVQTKSIMEQVREEVEMEMKKKKEAPPPPPESSSKIPAGADSSIPSEDIIRAARERRERMRGQDPAEFISLSSSSAPSAKKEAPGKTRYGESRLVREDEDDDGSLGNFDHGGSENGPGRMAMAGPRRGGEDKAVAFMQKGESDEDSNSSHGDDDEDGENQAMRRWEMEQIQKGGAKQMLPKSTRSAMDLERPSNSSRMGLAAARGGGSHKHQAMSLEDMQKSLNQAYKDGTEAMATKASALQTLENDLLVAQDTIDSLESQINNVSEQFVFFQETADFINQLLDCLDEKVPYIEEFERQLVEMRRDRFEEIRLIQQNDFDDDMEEAMVQAGGKRKRAEVEVDEFGRDKNMERNARKAKRQARTAEKAAAAARKAKPRDLVWSDSDDSSDDDSAYYRNKEAPVLNDSKKLFQDTLPEFSSLASLVSRFRSWKKKFPRAYADAYCSVALPTLFAPYVRLEMLDWQPLEQPHLDDMQWHRQLYDFGVGDEDEDLVPQLVKKVVLPKIKDLLPCVWDLYSISHNKQSIEVAQEVLVYLSDAETLPEEVVEFMSSLLAAMRQTCSDHKVPVLFKSGDEDTSERHKGTSVYQFSRRQWGRAVKLLKTISAWEEVLNKEALQAMCYNALLVPLVLPFLKTLNGSTFPTMLFEKALDCLPRKWYSKEALQTQPALRDCADLLKKLTRRFEDSYSKSRLDTIAEETARRLVKLNKLLGNAEAASRIHTSFKL